MKILFQGDSITDTGRNNGAGSLISIGQGYALIADAKLSVKYPGKFEFINLAVSGSRIVDFYARIKADCWNRSPDVLSILLGVNDVIHESQNNGVEADRFENVYRMLLGDTLKRLPDIKIIIMEPFILNGPGTASSWDSFYPETLKRAEITRRLAGEFGLPFLPLQEIFDKACEICPAEYWIGDGVHPTPAGHQLIADAWIELFEKKILRV